MSVEKSPFIIGSDLEKSTSLQGKKRLWNVKSLILPLVALALFLVRCFIAVPQGETFSRLSRELYHISKDRGIDISPLKREPSLDPDRSHLHKSQFGAVSSDIDICSDLGVKVLEKGGFAADAAVTVGLCIGLINSFNSGIGGGGYMVSKRYDEDAISIDAREMAPLRSDRKSVV